MSPDTYRREIARLEAAAASFHKDLARFEGEAAKADYDERKKLEAASKSSSPSTRKSYLDGAARAKKKSVDNLKKAGEIRKKIASNSQAQATKKRALATAEKREQRAQDRATVARRQSEKRHALEIAALSAPQMRYLEVRPAEPSKLRVLYLTSNAHGDLRLDTEVRQVQQALRGAKYRDLVEVQQRPAATFQDLVDGLNDVRPHIVHFSGHGGGQAIALSNESLDVPEQAVVRFKHLMMALDATDTPPQLLVLNACDTLEGAEVLLPAVPVVIGMSDSVLDLAAAVFAKGFYGAIGAGQSVGAALKQGKVAILAAVDDEDESDLPQITAREDVNVDELRLVIPLQPLS